MSHHPFVAHLYRSDVVVSRDDGGVFRFKTYEFSPTEWGWALWRANGEPTTTVQDPNYFSEKEAIQAIHEDAPKMEWVSGYGWVISEPIPLSKI